MRGAVVVTQDGAGYEESGAGTPSLSAVKAAAASQVADSSSIDSVVCATVRVVCAEAS